MGNKSLAWVAVFAGLSAFAQSNQGTITGTISDPAGAVIAGAAIEVRNTATGVLFRGGSSGTGNYVQSVPAGMYTLTVNVPGFKKFVQENVEVVSATDTRKDVTLEVGSAAETVTVVDTAPLLKTESGEMSHQVTTAELDNLPVLTTTGGSTSASIAALGNIRNPLAMTNLLPAVTFTNDQVLVVNGLPSESEAIRIEGQDAKTTILTTIQQDSQASVDAIQEVTVQTSNFAAEYGRVGGGYFNFTMKSGANQLHGTGYDYFVNEALNAGLPFTDAGTVNPNKEGQHIRNAVRRNDYGFTVGGPIRIPKVYNGKDRTFFFFSFEQFREGKFIQNGLTTVPTQAYRNGNFSLAGCRTFNTAANSCTSSFGNLTIGGAPAQDTAGQTLGYGEVFDPNTTQVVNGAQVRAPFPNNQIPLTRFDPVSLAIQNLLPLPNLPGLINNYQIPGYPNWQHTTTYAWKVDHSISPTMKLSWYLSHLTRRSPAANGFPAPWGGSTAFDNRNFTSRVNFDDTLRPTLLFHVGIGYFQDWEPQDPAPFDQNSIGLHGYFDPNLFPIITGLLNSNTGGWGAGYTPGALGSFYKAELWEEKPTATTSLTWVKGNHIYKFGGEYASEGFPEHSDWRANGSFTFSNAETADPWQNGQPLNLTNGSGFPWASFLLGSPDALLLSVPTQTKLGNHTIGLYAQDSWKITRRLTLDYGLRYDFQTYLKEEHGRMGDASFSTPNPTVGGLLGAEIYEGYGGGRCNCAFSHNYPYALGPRLGAAFQVNRKTVLRGGAGLMYGTTQTVSAVNYGVADYYTYNSLGYGITPMPNGLQGGNPYPNITWPNFSPGKYPVQTAGLLPPGNNSIFFDPESRPSRILQWSIGVQREVFQNIVIDATYVGNHGVWFPAPGLDQIAANTLDNAILAHDGLSLSNPANLSLLTSLIGSPQAIQAGFGPAYPGMPLTQTVAQNLRPVPQWNRPTPYLGPPLGQTWYDALQTKVTKRFSHGLSAQGSFVWSKALLLNSTATDTEYSPSFSPLINDIYNYPANKQLNQLVRPLAVVISGTYTTPRPNANTAGMKVLSQAVRDWRLGWLLRYQNGALIQTPPSNNQLNNQLERASATYWNYVPGVNPLAVDPNCGCFNPQTAQILNPKAWTDAPAGTFGVSAPLYNNYRWQRQPAESMSFGRDFPLGKEGRFNLNVRAEFQNIFNRLVLSMPSVGGGVNPATALSSSGGINTGGYGYIATVGGIGSAPRSGQIVARVTF
ncbi:MAG TPA: TonB-dependent receptor [Bryobacteraceae bacterium]